MFKLHLAVQTLKRQCLTRALCVALSVGICQGAIAQTLPFDKPGTATLRASPKKVFGHYFTQFPLSIENANPQSDYYTNEYLKPTGESYFGSPHLAYGGFLRQRPLLRASRPEANWLDLDMQAEVNSAIAGGLDGFTLNIMATSGTHWDVCKRLLNAANTVDTGFKIVLMPDMDALNTHTTTQLADALKELAAYPAIYKVGSPATQIVISPYNAQNRSVAWWQECIQKIKTNAQGQSNGLNVAFLPGFQGWRNYAASYAPISYGLSDWGDANTLGNESTFWTNAATEAKQTYPGKIWMHPVGPQDVRPKATTYFEAFNTRNFRSTWENCVIGKADWVQVRTWNDYSECSEISPSTGTQHLFYDLNTFYLTWFKQGQPPAIVRDGIYYSHRQHSLNAAFDPTKQTGGAFTLRPGNGTSDEIEAVVFLKNQLAAQLEIYINGVKQGATHNLTTTAQMPYAVVRIPVAQGVPSFRLLRSGAQVAAVTSAFNISNSIVYQNHMYYGGSSLRSPVTQAAAAWYPKAGPGPNLLANPGFELDAVGTQSPTGWWEFSPIAGGDSASYINNSAPHSGARICAHNSNVAHTITTYQQVTGLSNGLYTAKAWVMTGGGQTKIELQAKDFAGAGSFMGANLSPSTTGVWTQLTIPNINVTNATSGNNGSCVVGLWTESPANKWLIFDDLEFYKQ